MRIRSIVWFLVAAATLLSVPACDGGRGEPPSDPGALSVELVVPSDAVSQGHGRVFVRFHNRGNVPLYILKPIDGSLGKRGMPFYLFAVRDEGGNLLRFR